MTNTGKDNADVRAALKEWLDGLDTGDLERMVASCDPEVVICNEHQPTTIGIEAVRAKYRPRIESSTFESTFDIEDMRVHGDFALLVGVFTVKTTNKSTGQVGGGEGRLVLCYRRHENGSWKLVLDVDNNAS